MRNYKENPLQNGELIPKEDLIEIFINQNYSMEETAKFFCIGKQKVYHCIKKYGIKKSKDLVKQKVQKAWTNKGFDYLDKDELYEIYITQNRDTNETAEYFNTTRSRIQKNLQYYGITKPTNLIAEVNKRNCLKKYGVDNAAKLESSIKKNKETYLKNLEVPRESERTAIGTWRDYEKYPLKLRELIPEDDLTELYINQNLSAEEVAKLLNTTKARVNNCVKRYNILKSPEKKEEVKTRIFMNKYGSKRYISSEEGQKRFKQTCLEKYGVENPNQLPEKRAKAKQTCLERYGVENPNQCPEIRERGKQTSLERYGYESPNSCPEVQERQNAGKTRNGTHNTSKGEEEIFELLQKKFTVKRQYKSEKYPFNCDFYVVELDLYIEYQGTWMHGHEPFVNNLENQAKLALWEEKAKDSHYYERAVHAWTESDPLKRETAKKNNLNWLEFFTMEEFRDWYNNLD